MNPPASAPARPNNQGTQSPSDDWYVQPQRIKRHRTVGDVLKGLGALLVLVVLLGAIPFALVRYIGWPLPHEMPSSRFFNQSITPDVLLKALAVIVWLAWAQFAACVVVEFRAAVRGIGMPARVPAAGPSQFLARQLIAALLMITASAASFVPNLSHLGAHAASPAPAQAPPAATAGVLPGSAQHPAIGGASHAANADAVGAGGAYNSAYNLPAVRGESGLRVASDTAATLSSDGTKLYRVQPPEGRHHDTLWEIAQRHLGDGRRYKEIYELNKDRVQPDGSRLTNAALIRPGWIMMMPPDATGGDLVVEMPPSPPQALGPAQSSGTQSGTSGSSDNTAAPAAPTALPSRHYWHYWHHWQHPVRHRPVRRLPIRRLPSQRDSARRLSTRQHPVRQHPIRLGPHRRTIAGHASSDRVIRTKAGPNHHAPSDHPPAKNIHQHWPQPQCRRGPFTHPRPVRRRSVRRRTRRTCRRRSRFRRRPVRRRALRRSPFRRSPTSRRPPPHLSRRRLHNPRH